MSARHNYVCYVMCNMYDMGVCRLRDVIAEICTCTKIMMPQAWW